MPPKQTKKNSSTPRNRIRIIGGEWRSRLIDFPDVPGLRPTPDRARETLFNWLGQSLSGKRCLDLFAGSGVLGLEAASRGAADVVLVEMDRAACAAIEQSRLKLRATNCRVLREDAMAWLARSTEKFDVIFVDPPFASGLMPGVLPKLAPLLADGGMIYAEWGEMPATLLAANSSIPLSVAKEGRAGASHFALLSPKLITRETTS